MSRKAIQFVEIDIPVGSCVYGVAPCTAAVGVTGDAKCFNTLATCQDPANYAASTVTLRFVEDTGYQPRDIEALPLLRSVTFNPAVLRPGVDLGDRATISITLADVEHADTGPGFDPYQTGRGYDPRRQGTLFGRFRARQPYLRDAELRWYVGYVGDELADMECRTFVVNATDGPSVDGLFTVAGIDPLVMLNGDRAMAPHVNTGALSADITSGATSATLTPAGIGNAEYAASGWVAMGSEIAAFTRSGNTLTLTRGQLGTTADAHSASDRVQEVLHFAAMDAADIIETLETDFARMPAGYIPLAEWKAETAAYLRRNYTGTVPEPTPVTQLVTELMAEAGLAVWWDDLAAQQRLRVLRALPEDAQRFGASNMLDGTFGRQEQPDARISQVRVFHGRKDPTKNADESTNYRQVRVVVDLDNEGNFGSAAIREVWSRWIPAGGSTAAQRVGDLLIGRYGTPPRRFTFSVMRDSVSPNPRLGNLYSLSWRTEQNADGSAELVPVQVVRLTPSATRFDLELEEMRYASLDSGDLANRAITIDYDTRAGLNLRTLHDELYPAPVGGETVTLTIGVGVTVGSGDPAVPALTIGSWPGGVTINVVVLGTLEGGGGAGGAGADGAGDVAGTAGGDGGTALYTRKTINLTSASGAIWGGGGGGGGGGTGKNNNDHKGGGGGGGAGDAPGLGGIGPGSGGEGTDGTRTTAGSGGPGYTASGFFASPTTDYVRAGGNGGGPGQAGSAGYSGALAGGGGGAAGRAIDGVSYVTTVGSAGDRRGGQVN